MAVEISMGYLQALTEAINQTTGAGKLAVESTIRRIIAEGGYENPIDLLDQLLGELEPYFEAVAENAASLSAQSYDLMRYEVLGETMGAQPYVDRDPAWTRQALEGLAERYSGNMEAFIRGVTDRVDYEAKRAAGSTQFKNGANDKRGPRFARVPTGAETCPFCIMLASRGFVYRSSKRAGQLDHYHPNCDCRIVSSWDSSGVAGYDPDEYLHEYEKLVDEGKLDIAALEASAAKAHKKARA